MKKIQVGGHRVGSDKHYALVDDLLFDKLNKFVWSFDGNKKGHGYARTTKAIKGKRVHSYMSRMVMGYNGKKEIDHINENKLDNRRENLRIATKAENARNVGLRSHSTTGFKGVSFHKVRGLFQTRITVSRKVVSLGYFKTAEEASKAYNKAALKYHGEFANIN